MPLNLLSSYLLIVASAFSPIKQSPSIDAPAAIKDLWSSESVDGPNFSRLHHIVTSKRRDPKSDPLREKSINSAFADDKNITNFIRNLTTTCAGEICEIVIQFDPSKFTAEVSETAYRAAIDVLVKSSISSKRPVFAISGNSALAYVW